MIDTHLAIERFNVEATITTAVDSIKNPKSGHIYVLSVKNIQDELWVNGIVIHAVAHVERI